MGCARQKAAKLLEELGTVDNRKFIKKEAKTARDFYI